MNAHDLLSELSRLGIRVESQGENLKYSPRSLVTTEVLDQIKTHKAELLAILQGNRRPVVDVYDANQVWQAALALLDGDPRFPLSLLASLTEAEAEWAEDTYVQAGDGLLGIPPPDPCPSCGSLELWQSLADNWHCQHCDPPVMGASLREWSAKLKRLHSQDAY